MRLRDLGGVMNRIRITLLVGLAVLVGCKRKDPREYPTGLPRGFVEEAIRMTEAVFPYCDDLLAVDPCPGSEAGPQDFGNESIVKALPILNHPFGDLAQVHDYVLLCETLPGHPNHINMCEVRAFGPGTAPPAACEQRENNTGWKDFGRTEEGENLSHPSAPGCPQAQFKLVIQRKTPKGGMATFIGNFKDLTAMNSAPK